MTATTDASSLSPADELASIRANTRKIKRRWYSASGSARTVDELNFTSREPAGRIRWWDVATPKTDYGHPKRALGRAYAFELLDLIHNAKRKGVSKYTFGFIACEIARNSHKIDPTVYEGFFLAISEFLVDGKLTR
jgi:hypothetical protein